MARSSVTALFKLVASMNVFQEIRTEVLINSEDLRRRFKEVKEIIHDRGKAGVLVNNRVDMVLMDVEVFNNMMYRIEQLENQNPHT